MIANIQEWHSMPFNSLVGKVFLGVLVGFLLAQIVLATTWQLAEFTLFTGALVEACLHARFLLVFVPVCAPLLAVILSRWIAPYNPDKDRYGLNAFLMIAVLAGVIWFFPTTAQLDRSVAEQWPEKTVQYLEKHPPPQPMFNSHADGGYLIYALGGRTKVFIDGRNDIYERTGVLADYASIMRLAPNTLGLLRSYNIQSCLIERNDALGTLLAASSEWQRVYADEMRLLFVRKSAGDSVTR
jgi:hypothetical protein